MVLRQSAVQSDGVRVKTECGVLWRGCDAGEWDVGFDGAATQVVGVWAGGITAAGQHYVNYSQGKCVGNRVCGGLLGSWRTPSRTSLMALTYGCAAAGRGGSYYTYGRQDDSDEDYETDDDDDSGTAP